MRRDEAVLRQGSSGRMTTLPAVLTIEDLTLLAKNGRLLLPVLCRAQLAQSQRLRLPSRSFRRVRGIFVHYGLHGPISRQILGSVLVKIDHFPADRAAEGQAGRHHSGGTEIAARPAAAARRAVHHHTAVRLAQDGQLIGIIVDVLLLLMLDNGGAGWAAHNGLLDAHGTVETQRMEAREQDGLREKGVTSWAL